MDLDSKKFDQQVDDLLVRLARRFSAEDIKRINDAYVLAREAHKEQRRKSGEPYIMHPVAVARIVAEELRLGANPIIAAFLHDVVEDTPYTIEDIRERFGDDVAFLVNVVTKKKKKSTAKSSSQIDNYKQMLDSLHYDIRALLIKLSDRLHNMRTLSSMRPDKQMKIAGETDYFYAPLAHRLGLYYIKREMENLSFRYRCPRDYAYIEEQLAKDQKEREPGLKAFMFEIERLLENNDILMARTEVYSRGPYSAWRKMHSTGCDFKHVEGKYYIRIIYPNTHEYSEKDILDTYRPLQGKTGQCGKLHRLAQGEWLSELSCEIAHSPGYLGRGTHLIRANDTQVAVRLYCREYRDNNHQLARKIQACAPGDGNPW